MLYFYSSSNFRIERELIMPTENAKEIRYVVTFLSVLSMIVLGSYIVDRNIADFLYLLFVLSCLVKYLLICFKK
jgi:hypothetical protein